MWRKSRILFSWYYLDFVYLVVFETYTVFWGICTRVGYKVVATLL
jgi:hypothetical protein